MATDRKWALRGLFVFFVWAGLAALVPVPILLASLGVTSFVLLAIGHAGLREGVTGVFAKHAPSVPLCVVTVFTLATAVSGVASATRTLAERKAHVALQATTSTGSVVAARAAEQIPAPAEPAALPPLAAPRPSNCVVEQLGNADRLVGASDFAALDALAAARACLNDLDAPDSPETTALRQRLAAVEARAGSFVPSRKEFEASRALWTALDANPVTPEQQVIADVARRAHMTPSAIEAANNRVTAYRLWAEQGVARVVRAHLGDRALDVRLEPAAGVLVVRLRERDVEVGSVARAGTLRTDLAEATRVGFEASPVVEEVRVWITGQRGALADAKVASSEVTRSSFESSGTRALATAWLAPQL